MSVFLCAWHSSTDTFFKQWTSLNDSLWETTTHSCRQSLWHWLGAHVLYSLSFSTGVNNFLYCVSYLINFRQQFASPDVHYREQFEGSDLDAAMQRGYRRLGFFVLQLVVLTLIYILVAYYYKWLLIGTFPSWLSIARWLIEGSCDYVYFTTFLISFRRIPASITKLDNHFAVVADMLLIMKINQFVMMRYAEFYSQSCLNVILVAFFYLLCSKPENYSLENLFGVSMNPDKYLPDFPR